MVADKQGNFEVTAKGLMADTISIGYVGFQTKKVSISSQQLVNKKVLGTIFLNAQNTGLAE